MKKTIITALLMIAGFSSYAQKIELGLNGGLAPYIWADNTFKNYGGSKKDKPGYYGSFKASVRLIGWQVGVSADLFKTSVEATNTVITTNDFKNESKYSNFTPCLFVNKLFKLPKSYLYAGVNGGLTMGSSDTKVSGIFNYTSTAKHSGYNFGMQLGYTVNIAKGLGANAEAGARYINMKQKVAAGTALTYNHLVFPVTLGVRYTL